MEFDGQGTVLSANKLFLKVIGYQLEEIEGRHHRLFVEPAYAASEEYINFWDQLRGGASFTAEFNRIKKEGGGVLLQATYAPVLNSEGRGIKVIKYAIDITGQKQQALANGGQVETINK